MDCRDFERWLDDGRAEPESAVARGHASECARCREALATTDEFEWALGQRFATTSADFTDRVMARLPERANEPVTVPDDSESPFPWWIDVLREPSAALGLALGLLYAVAAPALIGVGVESAPKFLEPVLSLAASVSRFGWWNHTAGIVTIVALIGTFAGLLYFGCTNVFDRLARMRAR
jgi:hypothetical protein